MSRTSWLAFRPRALLGTTALFAVVLLVVVLVPQILSRQARLEVLRAHVGEVARLAASVVDGDLHRELIEHGPGSDATRQAALAPLLHLHAAWPEAVYVYTMGVREAAPFFVLDTAQDAAFAAQRKLEASPYGEVFVVRPEYASDWLDVLAAGQTNVNRGFQYDEFGYFLSGHAPIRDSAGRVAGFAGVDFNLDYYLNEESRFRQIEWISALAALLLALLLGYAYARYRFRQQAEMQQHYEYSIQDSLTGLLNRRGALAAIRAAWRSGGASTHAALLVDIDHFKAINDAMGHAAGDQAILALTAALRGVMRQEDIAARLGGDEFLLFVRNCDLAGAEGIAAALLSAVTESSLAPRNFSVSIGVSVVVAADSMFDQLYRDADAALYRAKAEGRGRYAVHDGS
jgi:diguanylate cyclase (GGDEF)-like protein